jgi:F-type H+-transporting ATPase subunit a
LVVTIIGLILHTFKFFSLFVPEGTPLLLVPLLALIELISYIAKGLSLGIRLGANLISGHLLLLILAGFGFLGLSATIGIKLTGGPIAIILITAISGLELAIAGIQSYVYSILNIILYKRLSKFTLIYIYYILKQYTFNLK